MDPCPFVRLIVESLALKLPPVTKPAGTGVHPTTTPCFCVIQLQGFPSSPPQTSPLLLDSSDSPLPAAASSPVVFSLNPADVVRLAVKPAALTISVYTGRTSTPCWFNAGRLLGRVRVAVELDAESAAARPVVMKSGWAGVGSGGGGGGSRRSMARLHHVVRSEPDPRFVFQFGGEPECSPVVFQTHRAGGGCSARSRCIRQPAFSCRFSADRRRSTRSSSSLPSDSSSTGGIKSLLLHPFAGDCGNFRLEQRKGWTVTIHDLSGSPVAAASMITPFVPSPGSDRVSRANPGAWLILRAAGPTSCNWKPWGRLEAWRERGTTDAIGYRFELLFESGPTAGFPIAESSISVRKGGEFRMDAAAMGFVMESTVEREGRVSRPEVQVGAQHVGCMGDAAPFVALAAAVDLSMDACQLFSRKLRKELCHVKHE